MNKMTKRVVLPFLMLAIALPSFGQRGAGKSGQGTGQGLMIQELNLTAEQEDQMQSLRFDKEEILIKLRAKQQSAQLELRKLKRADEPNKKKIYAQIDKVGAARVAIDKARADHHMDVRKVLTAEQFDIFQSKMGRMGGRNFHGRGDARGDGRGEYHQGRRHFRN
ncbi:MAG: periplasmic heavy metal sensor [Candidatus Marinimicrobia bacterium]|nr:periplasmic heavy metal sensor [Candidatus Neomarinimicrobiota bacterium]MBT3632025.1 periplasmic heavy metal sensor [Candidatus Neomarinimicrobiota bacterium]MBT3824611.1 periplasmic heavy metal sensor [Candidatus Neomarinimicrobiota bacterium]MBT4130215.1 periplasmic heavy metal sensor [Candidatus Neomarinimicrobiota bacterium]MBT4296965.1 periplasmic heavy metal sensor [Candidatus Neomarinimicrobiota bacterium]